MTNVILTQPTHEDRGVILSCILQLLKACWNIGGFNAAAEILAGLRCVLFIDQFTLLHSVRSNIIPIQGVYTASFEDFYFKAT